MSFRTQEISTSDGRPASLYRLDWGMTTWFYTNIDQPVEREEIVKGQNVTVRYEPQPMSDNGMVQGSSSQNDFTVDGPSLLPVVRLFRGSPPSETIRLTVRRIHDDPQDAPIYWKGVVTNVKRPTIATCKIIGRPLSAGLKRTGLRLCWTRECPHIVYDEGCRVDPAAFRTQQTATTVSPVSITVTGVAEDNYYAGGYVEWDANDDGTVERRLIEKSVTAGGATELTIMGIVDYLDVGAPVRLYPGCNRTPEVCNARFNNLPNYGGFKDMPGASPFDAPIW